VNRVSIIALTALAVLLVLALGNAQTGKSLTAVSAPGRFQIVIGEYEATTNGPILAKSVFRIDTITGQTSRYHCCVGSDGRFEESWRSVPEPPSK
jgi:hypothetical protein